MRYVLGVECSANSISFRGGSHVEAFPDPFLRAPNRRVASTPAGAAGRNACSAGRDSCSVDTFHPLEAVNQVNPVKPTAESLARAKKSTVTSVPHAMEMTGVARRPGQEHESEDARFP